MSRLDALLAGLLSAGLAAGRIPFARLGVDLHHDGIMLKPALDVLSGQVLFRDTFMQYGALSCYLQVAALWLHPSLLAVRLLIVAAYAVTLFFLYAAWRLVLPRSLTVLSCGLLILFIPLGSFGRVFVHPVAGAWLLLLLLAAAAPGLVKRFGRDIPPRGMLAYYLCLIAVLAWQHDRVLPILALRECGWTAALPLLVLLPAVISVAVAATNRARPKSLEYYSIAALAALSLGSLLQYYPVPDSWHILWSLAPAFGLFTYVFWRWAGWPIPVVAVVLSAAFLPAIKLKIQSATQCLGRPLVTLTAPSVLRGMRVAPEQARSIGRIVAALQPVLQVAPDLPSALVGDDALYLCFTRNHTNPSPYFVTWRGLADNAQNQIRWDNIQRTRPLIFLLNARWEAVDDFYQRAHYVPLLSARAEALEIAIPQEVADAMQHPPAGPAPAGPP